MGLTLGWGTPCITFFVKIFKKKYFYIRTTRIAGFCTLQKVYPGITFYTIRVRPSVTSQTITMTIRTRGTTQVHSFKNYV